MSDAITWVGYHSVQGILRKRFQEPAPALLQLLIGPRQVGKTTLLLNLSKKLGKQALYFTADAPEASLPNWKEQIWKQAKELTKQGKAFLFIDEVQSVPHWSQWLKSHFDEVLKKSIPLHVVVSGSSSLKVGAGSRET
jgi:predicted AAA+ superfamily ATPase